MFQKVNVPVIGIVENMSTFVCPNCGHETHLFGHGGARREAERLGVPFLGELPLSLDIRERSDAGLPVVATAPDRPEAATYREIAERRCGPRCPGGRPSAGRRPASSSSRGKRKSDGCVELHRLWKPRIYQEPDTSGIIQEISCMTFGHRSALCLVNWDTAGVDGRRRLLCELARGHPHSRSRDRYPADRGLAHRHRRLISKGLRPAQAIEALQGGGDPRSLVAGNFVETRRRAVRPVAARTSASSRSSSSTSAARSTRWPSGNRWPARSTRARRSPRFSRPSAC